MMNNNFLLKHDAWIGIVAFAFAVFFTHAPFFLYIPLPGISMDTFHYFWFAKQIFEGALPVIKQPVEVPWGYPVFLYLTKVLNLNIVQIVFVQTTIFLSVGLWTISQLSKNIQYGGILTSVALIFFTFQPYTIRINTMLYTESLYTSALILVCGCIGNYLHTQKLKTFIFLLFSVLCAMLIRPNGVLLLSIPLLIILKLISSREKVSKHILVIGIVLCLDALGNFYFKGKFSIGDSDRITQVINNLTKRYSTEKVPTQPIQIKTDAKNNFVNTTGGMFVSYFLNFITSKPSFYYSLEATTYNQLVVNYMPEDTTLRMFDSKASVDSFCSDLRSFIFAGYPYEKYSSNEYSSIVNYDLRKSKWMYAVHLAYEVPNKLKIYYFIYLIFWLAVGITIYQYLIYPERGVFQHLILLLALIHLSSLFLLPFIHGRFQLRYIHVSEFIVFLNTALSIYYYSSSLHSLKYIKAKNA